MSAVTTPPAFAWPADVLAFARESGVEAYLDPLRDATCELFPTGRLTIRIEDDPELRDERHIAFDVEVPARDVPHFLPADGYWLDELLRIVPAPLTCVFRRYLHRAGE